MSPIFGRRDGRRSGLGGWGGRLAIAAILAGIALFTYYRNSSVNPVTGRKQHISLTVQDEIALGLQAAPEMARQFGGEHPDQEAQNLVDRIGSKLAGEIPTASATYPFYFYVLADDRTVNAFALPGGQVFITAALLRRLETEGQLAGVIGHEIGHVVARHSAEQMAKAQLTQGLAGAAGVAAGDLSSAQIAQVVGQFINMRYGREHELESDRLAVRYMAKAGYDPRAMIRVMEILAEASGGSSQPEFASTHPSSENRIQKIREAIEEEFPQGVPEGLVP